MGWESSKCAVILKSQEEVDRWNLRFYIGGGEIKKVWKETYLGMSLTTQGFQQKKNVERGEGVIQHTQTRSRAARLGADLQRSRSNFVLETYLRSRYISNAVILEDSILVKDIDEEVLRRSFNSLLKCRDRALTSNSVSRLTSLLKIVPMIRSVEKKRQLALSPS